MKLTLKLYSPHEKQLELHNCQKRFIVAPFGRQSGKSTWAINHLLKQAWIRPATKYWFCSPTYAQSRVMYRRLVGTLWACRDVMIKKNQSELRVKLINNSEIRFVSGEVLDNLRGDTLNGAIIDEVRDQSPDLWPMVIRAMLTTTRGWAAFISTPNGFDHFYDLSRMAMNDPDWATISAPSTANPLFNQDEFEAARRNMSEAQFAQEIMAEFRDITSGKAYINFGEHNKATECPWAPGFQWSPYIPVYLGPDFNLSPMSWQIGQLNAERWWFFDEVYLTNSHTMEAALVFRDKILQMKQDGFKAEPNVVICGDATGKATQRSSNQSDYDILKQVLKDAFISFRDDTPESNPSIKDRVNAFNAKCKNARGEVNMWVHPVNAPHLIHDGERVVWKTGGDYVLNPGKDKTLTHPTDGAGYLVNHFTPIKSVTSIGRTRILHRSI